MYNFAGVLLLSLVRALLLLLIAWVIAFIAKKLVIKVLQNGKFDKLLAFAA